MFLTRRRREAEAAYAQRCADERRDRQEAEARERAEYDAKQAAYEQKLRDTAATKAQQLLALTVEQHITQAARPDIHIDVARNHLLWALVKQEQRKETNPS